ncbi:cell surface protein [Methanosarcina siciliae C2J]|uniref:Cell surface protein n=1 Tax=Methanosarcina siciliae C2J TaxID=1434118 RepID=A0A0E3PM88_9EURY|nr:DUF3344 domain-containing protein [Methanosarcina siciliae]AKB36577.1 cell surface protein [Methanosarcina siciliae C2J]
MKLTRKKITGNLLRSLAVLLLLSLGVCTAAGEELYFEPQEAVFSDTGSVANLSLYLDQAPFGLAGYKLNLSISDPSVAQITGVEFPSWSGVNNSSSLPADLVQIKAVDLTENINAGDSDVFLCTVTVESLASGEANLTVYVDRLDDDSENTTSVTVREAKLTSGTTSENPIVSILPAESTLSSGESQVFEIRADNFPDGLSGYDFNLTLENPAVGNFTDVEYPSWVGLSENSSMPNTSIKVKAVDTNKVINASDENVLLASVTFVAETPGESEISLTFNRLDDDPGSNINAVTEASSVKVQGSSTLPVANFTATPTSGDSPLTVQFTDESAGSPTAWAWDFDNDDTVDSTEQSPSHTYTSAGNYTVNLTVTNEDGSDSELKTDYITVTQAGQVATNDLSISGIVNVVPASAVFARETNTVKVLNVQNTGTATLTNISIAVYASDVSSGTVPINTTTIASLAGDAKTTVTLIDPTIRDLEGGTVTYTAVVDPADLIAETDETNNNKSSVAKNVRYNGYKGKGIYWEGGSNITTRHTFDLQGDLLYSTQPDSAYKSVGSWGSGRTETWTASDLPVPSGSTIEEVFLYFAYNWDQTAGGYPWLNLSFNGNIIENGNLSTGNGNLYRDWSNFGAYADYEYGLCVYNVTDRFSSAGNSLVTNPYDGDNNLYGKVALYPSTLVVVYRNANETRKQIFINEECDELGLSAPNYGTTPEEATAYAPFTGMAIDVEKVTNAMLYSFAGSAGPDEGNLLFNGNIVASNAWQGSSNSGSPLVFDATNYINASGNEAGIQSTTSGGMDALQQILVVEYEESAPAAPVADFTAAPTSGDAPLEVNFTDISTGTVSSYAWDFNNDGTIDSEEKNPSYIYTSAGTYTVNLTVANAEGNDSEVKTDYITVSESSTPTEPVAAFTADVTNGTVPLTVNFTDQSTGSPSSWTWNFGDNTSATEQNPSHTYTSAGTYTVNLTVISESGNSSEVKADYITVSESSTPVEPEPVAAFTADVTSGTAPLTVNFTDQSTGTLASWAWDFDNDGNVDSTEQNPSYTYTAEGKYTVNLTVSSAEGSDSEVKAEYITVTDSSTPGDQPDLIVSSIIPPSGITANTSCNIGATISNTGESDAGAFNATLSVNGEVVDTSTVSGIGSGSSANVNFSWKPVAAGYYSVKVSADAEDAIDESDETNNELEDCIKVEEASSGSQNGSSSVSLNVTIVPVISLEVSPSALDFGELYPGKTSELQYLTLKNRGSCDVNVTAVVCDSSDGDSLFSQGLLLDSQLWNNYWKVVGGDSQENTSVALKVPADYAGSGNKKGTITFWAEAAE